MKQRLNIVDDDNITREALKLTIESLNFICSAAENAKEAIRILENNNDIAIAICDIMIPDTDGIELCKKIKEKYNLDPSEELLKQSKSINIKGDAENIPFEDHKFDVVISISALHHVNNIKKALQEIKIVGKERFAFSILKKGEDKEKLNNIIKEIRENFNIKKEIEEDKDLIFICNA